MKSIPVATEDEGLQFFSIQNYRARGRCSNEGSLEVWQSPGWVIKGILLLSTTTTTTSSNNNYIYFKAWETERIGLPRHLSCFCTQLSSQLESHQSQQGLNHVQSPLDAVYRVDFRPSRLLEQTAQSAPAEESLGMVQVPRNDLRAAWQGLKPTMGESQERGVS